LNQARYVAVTTEGFSEGGDLEAELGVIASDLNSRVPACAWGATRPVSCGASQCCVGVSGAGIASVGGLCTPVTPLNNSTGSGAGSTIFQLIRGVVRGTAHSGTLSVAASGDAVDVAELVSGLTPSSAASGSSACSLPEETVSGWNNVYPGTSVVAAIELNPDAMASRSSFPMDVELRDTQDGLLASASVLVIRR
jgi:hypothetical protein